MSLIESKLSELQAHEWYNQRFDAVPFFLGFIGVADSDADERKRGCQLHLELCFFKDKRADWYFSESELKNVGEHILKLAKGDAAFSTKLIAEWEPSSEAFYKLRKKIDEMNLEETNLKDLRTLFEDFVSTGVAMFTSSSLIDGFALSTDTVLAERIKSQLKEKATELFPILTAPTRLSFAGESEISLLRVGASLCKDAKMKQALLNDIDKAMSLLTENPQLKQHVASYYWIRNNYVTAMQLDERFFLQEIAEHLKSESDLAALADRIAATPEKSKNEKEPLLKQLDAETQTLIRISDDFTWWQDERKKATFINTAVGTKLLARLEALIGLQKGAAQYLSPEEVLPFIDGKIAKETVEARMNGCLAYWGADGNEVIAEKAVEFRDAIVKNVQGKEQEVKGLSAHPGKVQGPARIILTAGHIGQVQDGDILVAVMTRPDYLVGMKRAAAFVTNEGGVTCHAAIVARELKKPCVIGTKQATKVFKDGDLIEVDADNGIVRKL